MFGSLLRRPAFASTAARMANPQQVSYPVGFAMFMVPQDWMFKYFPNHTRDKVAYMTRFVRASMGMGAVWYWYYHTPYAGTHDCYQSPWYRWHLKTITENGTLYRNQAIAERHSKFYDGGDEDEEEEVDEE